MPFVISASASPCRDSASVVGIGSTARILRRGRRVAPVARREAIGGLLLQPRRQLRPEQAADLAELRAAAGALLRRGEGRRAIDGQPASGAVQIGHLSSSCVVASPRGPSDRSTSRRTYRAEGWAPKVAQTGGVVN